MRGRGACRFRHGHTALSWAAFKDRAPQVEALIRRGAEVDRRSAKHGRTALMWAAINGKHRTVSLERSLPNGAL